MISYLPCKAAFRPSCLVRRALPSHCRCSPAVAAWVGHSARSGGFADASGEEWWILNGWGDGMFIYVYVSISDYHWLSISLIQKDCSSRNLENWDHDWFHPAGFTNQHLGFYMILPKMWFMIRSSWIQNLPKKTHPATSHWIHQASWRTGTLGWNIRCSLNTYRKLSLFVIF